MPVVMGGRALLGSDDVDTTVGDLAGEDSNGGSGNEVSICAVGGVAVF